MLKLKNKRASLTFAELVGRRLDFVYSVASRRRTTRTGTMHVGVNDGHGECILVVDDDAGICQLINAILDQHGYRVACCNDGLQAITHFVSHRTEISLVLTDVDMPHFDGVALARALLHLCPEVKIIGMSGLSRNTPSRTDFSEIQKLVQAFLPKPFRAEDLLSTVHRMLDPKAAA